MDEMDRLSKRRVTNVIRVRGLEIGGTSPVIVQSMTNTDTEDIRATCEQIRRLEEAGCEMVRVAVPDMTAARAIEKIVDRTSIPVVADIHFDWRLAMEAMERGAHKLRLNPGNLRQKARLRDIVKLAGARSVPIRVGVNAGSLDRALIQRHGGVNAEALVESALGEIRRLESLDFHHIVVSMKAFDVPMMMEAHALLARFVDYPFHIGVTESGSLLPGSIRSSVGIGCLLMMGIGDTIRVSLTADPCEEVMAAYEILKSLNLRERGPTIISCPTCGRTKIDLMSLLAEVEERIKDCRENIKVAVMGCVVNGPGEARQADVGIAGGRGEGVLFRNGRIVKKVGESEIVASLLEEVEKICREKGATRLSGRIQRPGSEGKGKRKNC